MRACRSCSAVKQAQPESFSRAILQQAMASGVEGKLQVELAVKEGFKVAKRPAPKLQINPNTQFEVVVGGFNESVASKDADYFGGFKPLELRIAPAKTTQAGKYSLEAKFTYFYCSEETNTAAARLSTGNSSRSRKEVSEMLKRRSDHHVLEAFESGCIVRAWVEPPAKCDLLWQRSGPTCLLTTTKNSRAG